jgi:hypothetical protein
VKALLWLLGTVVVPMLLDQCTDVFPWLAEKLVRRAARRLPEAERPRWEEEWLEELASKPGGLAKLLWALWRLPLLRGSGEMGRLLGAPAISETIRTRLRTAWQRLRFRAKASPQDRGTAPGAEPAPVQIVLSDGALSVEAVSVGAVNTLECPPELSGTLTSRRRRPRRPAPRRPRLDPWGPGMAHLSDEEFIEWLAQQRQEFEKRIDQRVEEYRKRPAWEWNPGNMWEWERNEWERNEWEWPSGGF